MDWGWQVANGKKKTIKTAKRAKAGKAKKAKRKAAGASSVKGIAKTAARRTTVAEAPASSLDPIQFPEKRRKPPKTSLSAKELREFRALLLAKRAELCGDVERLTNEALNNKDGGAEQSSMPIHMADLGSDNWEREFTLGLVASERALVSEIDEALERIANKIYGVCLETHAPISLARLRAKPWAKYCIEYARAREEGRAS